MSSSGILERQWLNVAGLLLLLVAVAALTTQPAVQHGAIWNIGSIKLLWIAVGVTVAHHVWVTVFWRSQLHGGLPTAVFGRHAFAVYRAGFTICGLGRVASIITLACANRGTVPIPATVRVVGAILLGAPSVYLLYSIARYFTFRRAFGADHFEPDARDWPLVRQGIFRYTQNAMYTWGFLFFWAVAVAGASAAAFLAAGFYHAFIWVHFDTTEKPDMARIYGDAA
jgi:hypothetical protein